MNQNIQLWHLILTAAGLIGGWLKSHNALREKVIRLEEKVINMHDNHAKTDLVIAEMKGTIDKIWERMEKKADK